MVPSPKPARALALVAVPVSTFFAAQAGAQVVMTDLPDLTINSTDGQSVYFSLNTGPGGAGESSLSAFTGWQFQLTYLAGDSKPEVRTANSAALIAANTASDTAVLIDHSQSYSSGVDNMFAGADPTFLMLAVDGPDGRTYGWGNVGIVYGTPATISLRSVGYNSTPDQGLYAGTTTAVPEPSTYAALAGLLAGSAALYQRRRKKRSA